MARSPEHELQKAYFDWARLHPEARRAYAIPNGGQRNAVVAAKLKAEGVRAGVLDVHLPLARGGAHGLWIEHKAGRKTMSPEQAAEAGALVDEGFVVATVWDDPLLSIRLTQDYLEGKLPPAYLILKPERKK